MVDTLSLYELNRLVRATISQTFDQTYWVEAELAEARLAQNGHFYVELVQRDPAGRTFVARARGTMWAWQYHLLAPLFERATGERLRAGLKVRVEISVEFHEVYGYSLNITDIDPSFTLGDMAARRRQILQQLEADGIIDDNRQLPLPRLLRRIAVVSSAGAAGYGDFCDQLRYNDYGLSYSVRLFPAVMQGANVESSVLAALEAIAREADEWDLVVIIRGGGATSDLSDFDSYPLAAAVAQMPLPVLVGIGHERDETVLDHVAHTSVKTPTAAAAAIIAHGADELAQLDALRQRILHAVPLRLQRQHLRLQQLSARIALSPRRRLQQSQLRVHDLQLRLRQAATLYLQRSAFRLDSLRQRLSALDPQLQLRRGYSLTYAADGHLLHSVAGLHPGDIITTRLADGIVTSAVI